MRVTRVRKHHIGHGLDMGLLYTTDGEAGGGTGKPADPAKTNDGKTDDGKEPEPKADDKGDDWHAKFEGQQKVNRDLESKLNALRDGLKSALGVEDKKADIAELVGGLKDQLDTLTHTNLVNEVARRHKLDEDDIAHIAALKDPEAMDKLAARIAALKAATEATEKKPGKPGTPRPDPSQGRGGGSEGAKPTSVAQVMADRRAARDKKTTT